MFLHKFYCVLRGGSDFQELFAGFSREDHSVFLTQPVIWRGICYFLEYLCPVFLGYIALRLMRHGFHWESACVSGPILIKEVNDFFCHR